MSDSPITTAPKRRMDHPALAAQIVMNLNTSESCKNTPNVIRRLEPHHRALIESGSHSAAASPLPQRRLDKLQGVINDKNTPLAIRRRLEERDLCDPSPIVSRKFNQACFCVHSEDVASPFATRKFISGRRNTECGCVSRSTGDSIGDIDASSAVNQSPAMRRRVDSDCSCATAKAALSKRAMCRSDIGSKLGEPGVFSSPIHQMFASPAKSFLGEPGIFASPQKGASTDNEEDSPLLKDQNIVSGWLKFRDSKKWKIRWGVVTKLSPAAVTVLGFLLLVLVFLCGCISSILLVLGIRRQDVSLIGQWLIVFVIVAAVEVLKELVDVCVSEDGFLVTLIYISLILGFGAYFWLSIFHLFDSLRAGVPLDLIGI